MAKDKTATPTTAPEQPATVSEAMALIQRNRAAENKAPIVNGAELEAEARKTYPAAV